MTIENLILRNVRRKSRMWITGQGMLS